jgi:hypothetical protein
VPRRFVRYNPGVMLRGHVTRFVSAIAAAMILGHAALACAQSGAAPSDADRLLRDLGFSLQTNIPDKNSITFTGRSLLVPTPWGDIEATIVSTPVDRMVRVPLSPKVETSEPRLLPYVTAGSRKNVDEDAVLEQARPTAFADTARTDLKAGAGILLKLDENVELFGEYQFMRLGREDGRGVAGPLGTSLDASGFSLGLSVRY